MLWVYVGREMGWEYGPFTDEDKADIDGVRSAKAPYHWRQARPGEFAPSRPI